MSTFTDRQRQFEEHSKAYFIFDSSSSLRKLFGVSNSAKIIQSGLQLGVSNLDNFNASTTSLLLLCVIRFPPEDEVFFCIKISSDINSLYERLEDMKLEGASEVSRGIENNARTASNRNNLAGLYLGVDGKVYSLNRGFWDNLDGVMGVVSPSTLTDGIAFSIYPPTASVRRSLLSREFIGYLGRLVGIENVHELTVWDDAREMKPSMRRLPNTLGFEEIRRGVETMGGFFPDDTLQRYHAALNYTSSKHFVILAGISGSGKTQIALNYARAVHGLTATDEDPLLIVCPVRPDWTDPSGLLGYFDVLTGHYVVPPFLQAVLLATIYPDAPVFVLLDEMNLARVEYYLADVLSSMESGEPLQLHQNGTPLQGSTGEVIHAKLPFPRNLYITGTINIDETTNTISDKVLDRAMLLEMSDIDLNGYLTKLENDPELKDACTAAREPLKGVHAALKEHHLHFGYRTAKEFVQYLSFAMRVLSRPPADVIDELMIQKVLTRLRGSESQRSLLTQLQSLTGTFPRTQAMLERLQTELNETGSFQNSR